MSVPGDRIAAALALWRMVKMIRDHRSLPHSTREGVRWLAFDVSAALTGSGQVQSRPCDHDTALTALDALLDALVERDVPWADVVARVNQHRERRPAR